MRTCRSRRGRPNPWLLRRLRPPSRHCDPRHGSSVSRRTASTLTSSYSRRPTTISIWLLRPFAWAPMWCPPPTIWPRCEGCSPRTMMRGSASVALSWAQVSRPDSPVSSLGTRGNGSTTSKKFASQNSAPVAHCAPGSTTKPCAPTAAIGGMRNGSNVKVALAESCAGFLTRWAVSTVITALLPIPFFYELRSHERAESRVVSQRPGETCQRNGCPCFARPIRRVWLVPCESSCAGESMALTR